ncbi:MAG TPA: hypothetical protein VFL77_07680 [Solirubrobacterales bacterium]|nr:hypothetical protein [Solirubrobacterales bacterium]
MRAFRQAVFALLLTVAYLLAVPLPQASAAEEFYEYDPALSLVGNCDTSPADPVPDPGCPGGTHPPSGHFNRPTGVAVDSYGDEYVAVKGGEVGTNGRIDVFDDEGHFISELADPHGPQSVAVDKKGTLYALERLQSGDVEFVRYYPAKYEPGAGKIEYDAATRVVVATPRNTLTGAVAVDTSTDRLFAFDGAQLYEYASADELASPGEPNPLLHTFEDPRLKSSTYIAVDAQRRRLFISSCRNEIFECGVLVYKADFPYEFVREIDGSNTPAGDFSSENGLLSMAVDEATGHLFVEDVQHLGHRIVEFGPNFEYISTIEKSFLDDPFFSQIAVSNSVLNPGAGNLHYVFAPISSFSGTQEVFAFGPSTICEPEIEEAAASHLSETEGEVQATINPCGADTTYVLTLEEEGSGEVKVVGEGTIPGKTLPTQATVPLNGLNPGTSYRFEITATNEKGTIAAEGSFATYADASFPAGACPNEDLRVGPSSSLPDCRAFELVTPPDTNGRPVRGGGYVSYPFASPKASPDGNAVTFITEGGALPGTNGTGSLDGDRYRAVRGGSGWSTVQFGPTGTETETPQSLSTSPDQGFGFWTGFGEGTAVIGGFGNSTSYLQYPDGHSELVGVGSLGMDPRAEGELITENASHVVFQTRNTNGVTSHPAVQLEPEAPPDGTGAVYDRTPDGITHVVSLLPPDDATPAEGENAFYVGASRDGAGIAFEIGNTLYLRRNDAATYEIGENVAYAGVAEGGRRIFYVEGGDLLAFDAETDETIEFTKTGNAVVVNVAPDGDRAYFVSTTAIPDAGENPNGARPRGGQQNLYLSEDGRVRFIGIVTKTDVEGEPMAGEGMVDGLGLWATTAEGGEVPSVDPSRVNPTGSVLLFQSRADLDGRESGGSPQIYRYDSEESRLQCISCNPTGAAEGGGASLETFGAVGTSLPPIGSRILIPNLSPDGGRAVFESDEALVSTDNDAVQDVYEWEEAGVGSCTRAGGCVYLLSSGHSGGDNYLYAMSRSANDVFFVTADVLAAGDNDTTSVYDARVDGGFPAPPESECIGEGCRPGITSAPALTSPGRRARGAHDNVKPRGCPRGRRKVKRRGKVRCVRKHHKHHHGHRTTGKKRGAAR